MSIIKTGLKWSAVEKIVSQGVQLITLLILARFLAPESFGLIAMTSLFISIAQLLIDGGFTSALVRKGIPSEVDYSTAFFFNIAIGAIVYLVIYIMSPSIALFYNEEHLCDILRVLGSVIFFNSITVVHRAKLNVDLDFKTQSKVTVSASLVSGGLGLILAYHHYGVWALVFQSVSNSLISSLLYIITLRWKPLLKFDWFEFKDMFTYGYKLIASALIEIAYANSFIVIIGKLYASTQLGLFYQAQRLIELPTSSFIGIVQRVNLPLMSKAASDVEVRRIFSNSIVFATFIFTPLVFSLVLVSDALFYYVLGEQWLGASKYLMILCMCYVFYPIHAFNLNLLQVKKRSDLFLKVEIIKKIIGVAVILISYRFGIVGLCSGIAVTSILSLVVNCYYSGLVCSISLSEQFKVTHRIFISNFICLVFSLYVLKASGFDLLVSTSISLLVFWGLLCISFYLYLHDEFKHIKSAVFSR